jgi:hypothetical protein
VNETTIAAEHLRIAVMAMTEIEQNALATSLGQHATEHSLPRWRAFYACLAAFVDEAHTWSIIRDASIDLHAGPDPF